MHRERPALTQTLWQGILPQRCSFPAVVRNLGQCCEDSACFGIMRGTTCQFHAYNALLCTEYRAQSTEHYVVYARTHSCHRCIAG
jgi:hypothetical protein